MNVCSAFLPGKLVAAFGRVQPAAVNLFNVVFQKRILLQRFLARSGEGGSLLDQALHGEAEPDLEMFFRSEARRRGRFQQHGLSLEKMKCDVASGCRYPT